MRHTHVTKNDEAWEKLFHKYQILPAIERNGAFTITSEQINEFREARLMTKFDYRSNLPSLFREHYLSILPVTRGNYLISHFDAYQDMTSSAEIMRIGFPDYIESLDYEHITSEATAVHCAYISGILADFTEDEDLLPTVSGRMSSNAFSFEIKNRIMGTFVKVDVLNSQIEIDGGYEGRRFLTLIEAKNSISENFLIRQLYYPFRACSLRCHKPIKTIFLVYTNGIFSLYHYDFVEPRNYNSLVLAKQKNYCIEPDEIELQDIVDILKTCRIVDEPHVAFPQADSFKRVINVCELLYETPELTRDEITSNYDFDARQTNYYTDAGRYLGLIEKKKEDGLVCYRLTAEGHKLFTLKYKARQLKFVELILRHKVFQRCFTRYVEHLEMPSKSEIIDIMMRSDIYNINAVSTFERRAFTVSAWLEWIIEVPHVPAETTNLQLTFDYDV